MGLSPEELERGCRRLFGLELRQGGLHSDGERLFHRRDVRLIELVVVAGKVTNQTESG